MAKTARSQAQLALDQGNLIPNLEDNDPGTLWYTSSYNALNLAPKPGVGVLFDLGSPKPVGGFAKTASNGAVLGACPSNRKSPHRGE